MALSLEQADGIEATIQRLRDIAKTMEGEVAHLRKENESLWQSVHAREDALRDANETIKELRAMVERAYLEGAR